MFVPWLGLVAMIFDIWRAYDRLPAVIASHFNFAGQPNGWAPKEQLFSALIPVAFGVLCLLTFLLSRFPQISGLGWLLMVMEYWTVGLLVGLTHATLRVGLGESKTLQFPAGGWSLIMGLALVIGEYGRIVALRKRAHAAHGTLIAEENHGSAVMASVMAALSVAIICFRQRDARLGSGSRAGLYRKCRSTGLRDLGVYRFRLPHHHRRG